MFAMVERALAGIGLQARHSTTNAARVREEDYAEAPVVNFDMNLNNKRTAAHVEPDDSLAPNAGNSFRSRDGTRKFAVIGPKVFRGEEGESVTAAEEPNPRRRFDPTPDSVRMVAEHELLHVERHLGVAGEDANQELEAYTLDFVNYFHLQGRRYNVTTGAYLGKGWGMLLRKYDEADDASKNRTFNTIVDYYNSPPGDRALVKALFDGWVYAKTRRGRRPALVVRLATALGIEMAGAPRQ